MRRGGRPRRQWQCWVGSAGHHGELGDRGIGVIVRCLRGVLLVEGTRVEDRAQDSGCGVRRGFGVAIRGTRDQVAESFRMQIFGRAWEDEIDYGDGGERVICQI